MLPLLADFIKDANSFYIAIAVVALSILYYYISNRGLPPGPIGIPYFGYYPFFSHDNCHLEMHELAKKYGDVFSFTVTGRTYIHLGSYKATKEAHIIKADCFNERMAGFNVLYFFVKGGMVFSDYETWKVVRKFFQQQFRERGMSVIRESHTGAMYDSVKEAVVELKKQLGKPVDIAELIASKSVRIMRLTLLAEYGMTDEEMQELNVYYVQTLMAMTSKNLMLVGEFAKYFMIPFGQNFSEGKIAHYKIVDILRKMINKHKETYDEHNVRDAVDAYFKERDDRKAKNDPTYKLFTDKCLMMTLITVLGDGTVFVGMFVSAFFKALLDHPEEQEKLYQEIVEVCGLDRDPELEDKLKMNYTNAFILEVIRTTDLLTVFPSLECTKETTVNGYRIPKGAITVYNFYSAHMNTNDYEEPEKFNPARFCKEKDKRPEMLPLFGLGKRSCIGEAYAMNQVFLFLTTLIKSFRFSKPHGTKDRKMLFFNAGKLNVLAEPRKHK